MIKNRRTIAGIGLSAFVCLSSVLFGIGPAATGPAFSDKELMDGFERTVFGLEYHTWSWQPHIVKKYTAPVRFYVHNHARRKRTRDVHRFLRSLPGKIRGLKIKIVKRPEDANFKIYVVDRTQYQNVVRQSVYNNPKAQTPGHCLVRVLSDRRGISSSAAVIVSDEGEFLFKRCLVEEILQGLGPMNDDPRLSHSVFNDRSRHSRFTQFDRYILNMLYHPSVRPGMSKRQAKKILPSVTSEVRRYVR
ncbi:MAG: DUF2927 domain-containing protein [Stappiaceae bacterium]